MYREPVDDFREENDYDSYTEDPSPRRSYWRFVALILLACTIGVAFFYFNRYRTNGAQNVLSPRNPGILSTVKNMIFNDQNILEGQADDRVNILLLGIGGPGHDGPYLSDTNIIVSVKPSTKEVALISIPRDLAVKIPNQGVRKINYVNALGEMTNPGHGAEYTQKTFSELFNLPIHYYVRVDFKAFTEIIDHVGGVTVDVPRTFTDTQYPGPNFSYQTVHFEAGSQVLNGEQALIFSRSRHGNNNEASDFARSRRQQLVILALKDKLLSARTYTNPATIQNILESLSNHVATNLNMGQMLYLANLAKDVHNPRHLVIDSSPGGFLVQTTGDSGAYLLAPKTGDFSAINSAIASVFSQEPGLPPTPTSTATTGLVLGTTTKPTTSLPSTTPKTTSTAHFKLEIQNGTWRAGLAARASKGLQESGFSVITIGNSLKRPIDKTTLYILNPALSPGELRALSDMVKAPVLTVLPEWLTEAYDNPTTDDNETGMKYNLESDALLLLGNNFIE